jgi:hypothetical protein
VLALTTGCSWRAWRRPRRCPCMPVPPAAPANMCPLWCHCSTTPACVAFLWPGPRGPGCSIARCGTYCRDGTISALSCHLCTKQPDGWLARTRWPADLQHAPWKSCPKLTGKPSCAARGVNAVATDHQMTPNPRIGLPPNLSAHTPPATWVSRYPLQQEKGTSCLMPRSRRCHCTLCNMELGGMIHDTCAKQLARQSFDEMLRANT